MEGGGREKEGKRQGKGKGKEESWKERERWRDIDRESRGMEGRRDNVIHRVLQKKKSLMFLQNQN